MNASDLEKLISSLSQDIEFVYKGKIGGIYPFSKKDIKMFYDNNDIAAGSVENAMNIPFVDGKSLNEISTQLNI